MLIYMVNGKSGMERKMDIFIRNKGHRVISFRSFTRLLKKSHPPADIIFINLGMPRHSASKAFTAIQARYPESEIVVMDGFGDDDPENPGLVAGKAFIIDGLDELLEEAGRKETYKKQPADSKDAKRQVPDREVKSIRGSFLSKMKGPGNYAKATEVK